MLFTKSLLFNSVEKLALEKKNLRIFINSVIPKKANLLLNDKG